jgi:homoserine dehydrogenase
VTVKVGLLGLGTVGIGTAKILLDPAERHPLVRDVEIYRVGCDRWINPANRVSQTG